ncbi:putative AAA+ superfamily ATPase [Pararhizobium capsulatum DSM 1112]|uniref:AAA+ superfamily ATPase n=1 Tax=Pararhizobium capsulatum DSM 1112 TaxID=1121113 RepID=A0ABU0BYH6_9HYPH|nr:ATP-binding protein [Pararhizobium capsulatum]MDQ0323321.1 putative AAA+ superfamily ATPase [Pararhizobium capsulatum DSM 1112]
MNDPLLPRHLETELKDALASARVVNIIGPRQVGKTTLVRDLMTIGKFITLDDPGILAALDADPKGQLDALIAEVQAGPLIIDEAQRSTNLALALKRTVDENRKMGQFVLTGSSNIFTSSHVADSLAGRVQTMTMLPMSVAETKRMGPARILDWASADGGPDPTELPKAEVVSRAQYIELILAGGFPEIRSLGDHRRRRRYRDYVDSVVERDVASILKIRKSDAMRRMIEQLAVRVGNELNVDDLGGKIGIQRNTTETYLDILTKLSLLKRLPAWTSGENGRDIRQPKIHLVDTGLVAALRSMSTETFNIDANPTALGGLFENFVHNELWKSLPYQKRDWRLYHWRHQRGREIDIVAEADRTLVGFEMKTSTTVDASDFQHLQWFQDEGPGRSWTVIGVVIYMGDRVLSFGRNLFALPLSVFWSFPDFPA